MMPIIVEKRPGLGQWGTRLGCIQEGLREEEDCICGMGGGNSYGRMEIIKEGSRIGMKSYSDELFNDIISF